MASYSTIMGSGGDAIERKRATLAATTRSAARRGRSADRRRHDRIGMTMEYSICHYFKHVTMIDKLFGMLIVISGSLSHVEDH